MEHKNEAGRRSLFCCHYARLGDVAEAARCAGYPAEHAAAEGAALLRQASCRRMVEAYRSALQGDPAAIVRAGLERLAFGRTNDVIQLLLAEEPMTGQQIQALDLFPVASLKRDKSGGMEVHFFDRLKALTTLFEKSSEADGKNAAASLLAALGGGGAFAYIKFIKPKQGAKVSADPDDYEFEDEEYENEDDADEPEETEDADA